MKNLIYHANDEIIMIDENENKKEEKKKRLDMHIADEYLIGFHVDAEDTKNER